MNVRFAAAELPVHDIRAALAFYGDVLGFDVRAGGGRGLSVGPPGQPDVGIRLVPPDADGATDAGAANRRALDELTAKGLLARIAFRTPDCDTVFDHLATAGADVMQEPATRSRGVRDCAVLDPSGNMLRFLQDT